MIEANTNWLMACQPQYSVLFWIFTVVVVDLFDALRPYQSLN
jgi:hypothetical protein